MQIHHLSKTIVLNHFLGQIRNVNVHNDSMRFKKYYALEKYGV
jgi:uracil phosphoribosyltransferase